MQAWFDKFWHRSLGRPYKLARPVDSGQGVPVVLLHGIGRTGQVWRHIIDLLTPLNVRVLVFDLLGFGASPKPVWPLYDADDHAKAVIHSLEKARLGHPVILVGHSMGCLVAVRVAWRRPDLVQHLVLYEMPLYEGLPEKKRYRLRTEMYFRLYRRITQLQPNFNDASLRLVEKLARKITGLSVSRDSWLPFVRSLENTIMRQTTAQDIKGLSIAMDVIYGSFDMLVIRGEPQQFFGDKAEHITAHTIRTRHVISPKASRFIVARVQAALERQQAAAALDKSVEVVHGQ